MFTRSHHQLLATALGCLDADRLRSSGVLFAGGTALTLRFGEYRESVDLDFVVSDADAYQRTREACRREGLGALAVAGQRAVTADPMRIDQYGIRTRLWVAASPIKFEIIREARVSLDPPSPDDAVAGLATPTLRDLMAMTLLANSDRWTDPTVFSRDVIDVAMAQPRRPVLDRALHKAVSAYGDSVVRDAHHAAARLLDDRDLLERCTRALSFGPPRALLVDRLRRLVARLPDA